MTLTMGHNPNDSAEKLAHAISKARTALTTGGEYRDQERGDRHNFQIAGIISRIEVTWSQRHGYHFHLHLLLMIDKPLTAFDLVNLQARFHHRWKKASPRKESRPTSGKATSDQWTTSTMPRKCFCHNISIKPRLGT